MKRIALLSLILISIMFSGCAFDLVHVDQIPAHYESTATMEPGFKLTDEVHIDLGTGYSRQLNKGTKWNYVNTIRQGDIFRTKDQILTVEG